MNSVDLNFQFEKKFSQTKISVEGKISFTEDHWVYAVMGPSGVGKTTWARWVVGLLSEDRGKLSFGSEIWCDENQSLTPQSRRIGFLAQGDHLFPHLNVQQNIAYGLRKMETAEKQSRVQELMSLVGASEWALRDPKTLSGGQKRRVALAQVLAIRPQLLILDEPFTGLDEESKNALMLDLKGWISHFKVPTILITHQEVEAKAFAAKIFQFASNPLLCSR